MIIKNSYHPRPVRFLEVFRQDAWQLKIYSISVQHEFVQPETLEAVKQYLPAWLENSNRYPLETYQLGTLILHEGKDYLFAIINWWIDENMLQQFVYRASYENKFSFELYSDNGMSTCVWEMAVLWFERNAWVEYILKKAAAPDINGYLEAQLNADI